MIVYNVGRRWFAEKLPAYRYRVTEGLPPAALSKITVSDRSDLAALLNGLCEPPPATPAELLSPFGEVIDRAYVPIETDVPDCVPRFLLDAEGQKEWDRRHAQKPV